MRHDVLSDLAFFRSVAPLTLAEVAARCGADLPRDADPHRLVHASAMPDIAGADEVSFVVAPSTDAGPAPGGAVTRAGVCLVAPDQRGLVPAARFRGVAPPRAG